MATFKELLNLQVPFYIEWQRFQYYYPMILCHKFENKFTDKVVLET